MAPIDRLFELVFVFCSYCVSNCSILAGRSFRVSSILLAREVARSGRWVAFLRTGRGVCELRDSFLLYSNENSTTLQGYSVCCPGKLSLPFARVV